eukprot:1528120-Prymnesium_polylepis.1
MEPDAINEPRDAGPHHPGPPSPRQRNRRNRHTRREHISTSTSPLLSVLLFLLFRILQTCGLQRYFRVSIRSNRADIRQSHGHGTKDCP